MGISPDPLQVASPPWTVTLISSSRMTDVLNKTSRAASVRSATPAYFPLPLWSNNWGLKLSFNGSSIETRSVETDSSHSRGKVSSLIPTLARITNFAMNSLDGGVVNTSKIFERGPLEQARRFAVIGEEEICVKSKRMPTLYLIPSD